MGVYYYYTALQRCRKKFPARGKLAHMDKKNKNVPAR